MTDRDSFLRGYLLGKFLKLPHTDRPAQISPSAASGTYDKNSFLSGLAAAFCACGAGLSGTWNPLYAQFVTFPQWAAHFDFTPLDYSFTVHHNDQGDSFTFSIDPSASYIYGSSGRVARTAGDNRPMGSSGAKTWLEADPDWFNLVANRGTVEEPRWVPYNIVTILPKGISLSQMNGTFEYLGAYYPFTAPVEGRYTVIESRAITGHLAQGGIEQSLRNERDVLVNHRESVSYMLAGQDSGTISVVVSCPSMPSGYVDFWPRIYKVEPTRNDQLELNQRPGSVNGDYGILRSDGTISRIFSGVLVREEENTVFNPARNMELPFSEFDYDYEARTYSFTVGPGTLSLSYGNEIVSIEYNGVTDRLAYAILERT